MEAYRNTLGFEKTFLDGDASLGLRMPIDTLYAKSVFPDLRGINTSVGNLSIFGKYVLWQDRESGSLISTGMAITTPNGPGHFAGSPIGAGFHDAQLQPFVGFIFAWDKWYLHGFTAIDIATDPRDVTLYYNDIGIGYFLYQAPTKHSILTAVAPTFEVHINDPLNHRGALRNFDPAGTQDIVALTSGVNTLFGTRSLLSAALVTPVTGPKPFDLEVVVLLNVYFGKSKYGSRRVPVPMPPVIGASP
jgi:hypothetical protein